jgi:phosphatidylglycerophosphate synthase
MNNILEFFKSEIDRDRKIGHLSYFLIFRPISFLFTILFILLKINAKKITFFRLIFLIFTYLYCITIDLNYYYVIFLNLFTVKILDFCDGSIARYFNENSLKGKLFENLVDYLAFLYPLTIYLYNLRINNYFYNQEVDFLLTIFLIISYYFPTYLRNRIEILSNFEKNSNKTSIEKKFSKTNKNLKEYYELIHSLILLFLIALIVSELFQYALMILFLFRVFPFFSVFKSYKIFN